MIPLRWQYAGIPLAPCAGRFLKVGERKRETDLIPWMDYAKKRRKWVWRVFGEACHNPVNRVAYTTAVFRPKGEK